MDSLKRGELIEVAHVLADGERIVQLYVPIERCWVDVDGECAFSFPQWLDVSHCAVYFPLKGSQFNLSWGGLTFDGVKFFYDTPNGLLDFATCNPLLPHNWDDGKFWSNLNCSRSLKEAIICEYEKLCRTNDLFKADAEDLPLAATVARLLFSRLGFPAPPPGFVKGELVEEEDAPVKRQRSQWKCMYLYLSFPSAQKGVVFVFILSSSFFIFSCFKNSPFFKRSNTKHEPLIFYKRRKGAFLNHD